MRYLVLVVLLVSLSSTARADAIYEWVNAPGANYTYGTLSLSDDAFLAGGVSGVMTRVYGGEFNGVPTADPPMTVSFDLAYIIFWPPFDIHHEDAAYHLNFALTVDGDELDGFFNQSDTFGSTATSGTKYSWGNVLYDTTWAPHSCSPDTVDRCDAYGGYWELVSAPGRAVPEPGSMLMLLIGLAGLGMLFHRRHVIPR